MSSPGSPGAKEKIRVLIIPGSDPVGDWMANVINFEPSMAFLGLIRDLAQVPESLGKLSPDVILVDISSGILQHGDLINRLSAPVSGTAVIVVAMMSEVDMVRQAMLYGAQGFLLKPFSEQDLLSSVRQAYELVAQRRAELADMPQQLPSPAATSTGQSEIIAVFSPKGGVGCTTIAINLAVALKVLTNKAVTLVDADLRFGDIDTALNITTSTSIGTLLPSLEQLDDQLLSRSLASHSSGIKVLVAPPYLDAADAIHPEDLRRLLVRLSRMGHGYVVVDAWSTLDDCTLAVLDTCQRLVVVTTPQVTALRDVHRFLDVLKLLRFDAEKAILVLNHCYQRSDLRLQDVERALGHTIAQTIEYTPYQVTDSINRGVSLIQEFRDSPAAKDILSLARQLVDRTAKSQEPDREVQAAPAKTQKPARRGFLFRGSAASADKVKAS
jgi:pilus assembly protein CpaE